VNFQDPACDQEQHRLERPGDDGSLEEIVEQLDRDPEERWHAMEGLGLVEPEVRLAIIAELSHRHQGTATTSLLRLLCAARDLATRDAARAALHLEASNTPGVLWFNPSTDLARSEGNDVGWDPPVAGDRRQWEGAEQLPAEPGRKLVGCLVTPVDGRGRGSIAISTSQTGQRRTAAFLCDVRRGIRDVFGDVEPESRAAGRLSDELSEQVGAACVRDVPALALRLLAGCFMLSGREVDAPVRDWLSGTLGPDFRPAPFPAAIPGMAVPPIPADELPRRALAVLDACPTWIDTSPLASELARAILLREGSVAADPDRDAGAYRYLFEHRLIYRLELYGRMLLWMAWFWWYCQETDLSEAAQVLGLQLCDEQYAVPAHPFAIALTTRSLAAAQAELLGRFESGV
jgi:hypothetical protein